MLLSILLWLLGVVGLIGTAAYVLMQLRPVLLGPQNLKKKYNAEWAVVTGGSSGIGLAVTQRLAAQGINVVVAAFPDKVLDTAVDKLVSEYAGVSFVKLPVNLGQPGYFEAFEEACAELPISIVFLNAGYIKTGFFADTPRAALETHHECNATSVMRLSHYFLNRFKAASLRKAALIITSSPAGFMPTPFSVTYGATKAFLTEFAASLAPEVHADGIDVTVVHPSPVKSRFYDGAASLDALEFFKSTGTTPTVIADIMFASVGRLVVCDQGYYSLVLRLLLKALDASVMTELITRFASSMGDYKKAKAASAK